MKYDICFCHVKMLKNGVEMAFKSSHLIPLSQCFLNVHIITKVIPNNRVIIFIFFEIMNNYGKL